MGIRTRLASALACTLALSGNVAAQETPAQPAPAQPETTPGQAPPAQPTAPAQPAQPLPPAQPAPAAQPLPPAQPPPPPPVAYQRLNLEDQEDQRPETLPYHEGQPTPPGYYYDERYRMGLLIPGAAMLGATWIISSVMYPIVEDPANSTDFIYIPIFGPWVSLGTRDPICDEQSDTTLDLCNEQEIKTALVLSGIMQAVGTGMLVLGFTWTDERFVRTDYASVSLSPLYVRSGGGLGLSGRF